MPSIPCLLSSWRHYGEPRLGPDSTPNDEEPDYTVFDVPGNGWSVAPATAISVSGGSTSRRGVGGHTTLVVGATGANLSTGIGFGYRAGITVTGGVGFSF